MIVQYLTVLTDKITKLKEYNFNNGNKYRNF